MAYNSRMNKAHIPHAAFLRGINVGGNNLIKMSDLKQAFESMGFTNVKTLLASGNVLFDAAKKVASKTIEQQLEKKYDRHISVIVRTVDELKDLADGEPFKKIRVTPQVRLYISLLPEKPASKLKIPYVSPDKSFEILQVRGKDICSVLTLSPDVHTPDAMKIIEKEFGKNVTTRNWNTIMKIVG